MATKLSFDIQNVLSRRDHKTCRHLHWMPEISPFIRATYARDDLGSQHPHFLENTASASCICASFSGFK